MSRYSSNTNFLFDDYTQKVISVSTSAVELFTGSSRNPDRQFIRIRNDGSRVCYIGPSGVTSSGSTKGEELAPGDVLNISLGDVGIFAITNAGTTSLIVTELA